MLATLRVPTSIKAFSDCPASMPPSPRLEEAVTFVSLNPVVSTEHNEDTEDTFGFGIIQRWAESISLRSQTKRFEPRSALSSPRICPGAPKLPCGPLPRVEMDDCIAPFELDEQLQDDLARETNSFTADRGSECGDDEDCALQLTAHEQRYKVERVKKAKFYLGGGRITAYNPHPQRPDSPLGYPQYALPEEQIAERFDGIAVPPAYAPLPNTCGATSIAHYLREPTASKLRGRRRRGALLVPIGESAMVPPPFAVVNEPIQPVAVPTDPSDFLHSICLEFQGINPFVIGSASSSPSIVGELCESPLALSDSFDLDSQASSMIESVARDMARGAILEKVDESASASASLKTTNFPNTASNESLNSSYSLGSKSNESSPGLTNDAFDSPRSSRTLLNTPTEAGSPTFGAAGVVAFGSHDIIHEHEEASNCSDSKWRLYALELEQSVSRLSSSGAIGNVHKNDAPLASWKSTRPMEALELDTLRFPVIRPQLRRQYGQIDLCAYAKNIELNNTPSSGTDQAAE